MGAAQSDPQVLHEAETGAGPVAAPATNIVRTTKQHGIVIRIWAEDLHKGATRLMDDLLDDKEAIKRKKGVEADIKKMWEIYRENLEFGCIISTDCIEDAEAPSAPVSSELERSGSLASRHPSPPMGRQRSSSPVGSPLTPTAKFAREWLVASSSAMSRLDTPLAASCPHTSPLGQEGDEGGEGCVAPRHGDLPGDLAPSGEERGRPLSRQRSSSPVETSQRFSSPIRPKPSSSPVEKSQRFSSLVSRQPSPSPIDDVGVLVCARASSPVATSQRFSSPITRLSSRQKSPSEQSWSPTRSCKRFSSPVSRGRTPPLGSHLIAEQPPPQMSPPQMSPPQMSPPQMSPPQMSSGVPLPEMAPQRPLVKLFIAEELRILF